MFKSTIPSLKSCYFIIFTVIMTVFFPMNAQTVVNSLEDFQAAMQNNNQEIILEAGNYYLEDLPSDSRVINCTGSGNIIDMTGARINTLIGSIREVYFIVSGNNNVLRNGAIEDFYRSGLDEVTDFSAYNNDRDNLAYGLRGDPIMSITGNQNLVQGLEMIVKGSFPYGYGSQYGIGSQNTFGLSKRCGILITGTDGGGLENTLDGITMYHYAFGHGIFMQEGATETVIKNCYIEGRMRLSDDMYGDTETFDLPYLTNYLFPADEADSWKIADFPWTASYPIPYGVMYPLSEDGIRSYTGSGSVTVENCTVKQMRGGIRLYLATSATVANSVAIDCGATNFNMPTDGTITGSSGNFNFGPLNDNRLSRSRQDIEMTIIPSPNAIGPHNIADVLGSNHNIVFHRTPGPLDSDEERAIVVTGDNSTIVNETEYAIILEASANGNTIISCGPVTDNGSNNSVSSSGNCEGIDVTITCDSHDAFDQIEAEDFCNEGGIEIVNSAIGFINNEDWAAYVNVDFSSGANSVEISVASATDGGNIEIRKGSTLGTLLGTVEVPNTGSFTTWETVSASISGASDIQDVYFVFTGGSGFLFDVDWFRFLSSTLSVEDSLIIAADKVSIYPNPVSSITTIKNAVNSSLTVYDMKGSAVFKAAISSESENIDLNILPAGVYYAQINNTQKSSVLKLVKE